MQCVHDQFVTDVMDIISIRDKQVQNRDVVIAIMQTPLLCAFAGCSASAHGPATSCYQAVTSSSGQGMQKGTPA